MTDIDHFAIRPCVRGCQKQKATDDQPALFMGALHGHYCDRCYWRTHRALGIAAALTEHILGQVSGIQAKADDGSQKLKKHPPLPLNVEAFNDANEIYSRLVYWTAVFATRLNQAPPAPAARAWRTEGNRVVGLPNDVAPAAARNAVRLMATWLEQRLDAICALPGTDDVDYFHDELKDIYRTNARWPQEDQPRFAKEQCPDESCKGRIAIYPPQFAGDDQRIICEKCNRLILPKDYAFMAEVFEQVNRDKKRAAIIAQRLLKRYGDIAS
jgi:hypothetical protein